MRIGRVFLILFIIIFTAALCLAQTEDGDTRSLGEIARELRAQRHLDQSAGKRQAAVRELVEDFNAELSFDDVDDYEGHIRELVQKQDFQGLEHAADRVRSTQSRFPGGTWKLFSFYEAVGSPGRGASEAEWSNHFEILKRWNAEYPQSVTARISLAQAYLDYGIRARGVGESDTVTDGGWQKLSANTAMAEATLREAANLPEKCPYYYSLMLDIATFGGWSRDRTQAVLEEAIQAEPDFYHYYRIYANYLQPKWYGQPGESVAFAKEIADRIGGDEGNFVYFEIGSVLGCNCDTQGFRDMSWPRIKQGYAAMEELYGTSSLKMNRFAYMATEVHDQEAAKQVFVQIGDSWDPKVWRSREEFEAARSWAASGPN